MTTHKPKENEEVELEEGMIEAIKCNLLSKIRYRNIRVYLPPNNPPETRFLVSNNGTLNKLRGKKKKRKKKRNLEEITI